MNSNHPNLTETVQANSNSVTLTSQSDWEIGTSTNINTTSIAGSIEINDKTSQNNYLTILSSQLTASPDTGKGNIVDADNCSSWFSTADDSNVVIDLGQQVSAGYIDWLSEQPWGNTFGGFYNPPYYSTNGTSWNMLSATTTPTTVDNNCYHNPGTFRMIEGPANFRYIKIQTFPGLSGNPVNDLKVYTKGASATQVTSQTQLDGTNKIKSWTTFAPSGTIPANTSINFRFRTSTDHATWGTWTASTAYAGSIDIATLLGNTDKAKRYLQVETTLANTDGASTPVLDAYTANYDTVVLDHVTISPLNPSVEKNGTQAFTATAIDDLGNPITDATFNWGTACGSIDGSGNFTAPAAAGSCTVTVSSTVDGVTKSASTSTTITDSTPPPVTPTCSDGIQNGNETGVDCGGSCGACPVTPPVIPPPPPYVCMFGWAFLNGSWFCGDATDMVLILTSPNDGGSYKIGDYIPISFKFNAGYLASDIDKTPIVKSPSLFADVYLTIDSVNYFKVLTDIDYSKNASKVDNGYILSNLQFQVYNDSNLATSKGKILVRIHTNSADSPATIVPNPETSGYVYSAYDTSDKPFTILSDTISTSIHITIDPTDVTLKMGEKATISAKATDQNGQDVTDKTIFTFRVSDGGSVESQQGNIAVIVAGKNEIKLADAINVTGEYSGATAKASASLNVVGNKPICIGDFCVKIPPDVCIGSACVELTRDQLLSASTTTPIAAAGLIALLALIAASAANLFTLINPSQVVAYYVKGFEKKAKCLVYDAITGMPIPLATILLFRSSDKKLMSTVVSDRVGMFSVVAPPETECFIEVRKDHYALRQLNVYIEKSLKYQNNYFGGNFKLTAENPIFAKAIPLISTDTSNAVAKRFSAWERASRILRFVNFPILIFGFATAIIVLYDNKTTYNEVIVAIYALTFAYYLIKTLFINGKTIGKVTKSMSTEPIQLAIVRAITADTKKLYQTVVSDEKGRFVMTVKKGAYDIISSKAGFQQDDAINVSIRSNFQPVKEQIWMSNVFNYQNLEPVAENQPAESIPSKSVEPNPVLNIPNNSETSIHTEQVVNSTIQENQPPVSEPTRSFNDSSQIIENFHRANEYQSEQNDTIRE
ncbi:MAG: hypothetical protein WCG99_03645 [Candidatus Berkelbacteria bacterium]